MKNNRNLLINKTLVNEENPPYIIAEVGHNHQGSISLCKRIFLEAKNCGASAVKLQKRFNKTLFSKKMYNQEYNSVHSYGKTYGQHREKLEFNRKQYIELKNYCKKIKIDFFSTAFDKKSVDFLVGVGVPAIKIASGDSTNHELLEYAARKKIPLIISTGGSKIIEVEAIYNLVSRFHKKFAILQCTSGYPPSFSDLNLNVIKTYRDKFKDIVIGYSGHENGISIPVAAYALGAKIIEKHFTIDRTIKGTDQALSLSPSGLRRLVRDLNRTYKSLGDGKKIPYKIENEPLSKMVKLILAKKFLKRSKILSKNDVEYKITGTHIGLRQCYINKILGKKLRKNKKKEEILNLKDFYS